MKLLWSYVKQYKKFLGLALVLATVNQVFSLLDPQIFRLLVDNYAKNAESLARADFFRGVSLLLLASVGVALVSRIAKNFQDYFVNVVTQRVGTRLYAHGVEHSFSLPYSVFEDQQSGALLQKLQKARTDSQILIASSINIVFLAIVGILFVITYAFFVHWSVGAVYFSMIPVIGFTTFKISRKIKTIQKKIVAQSTELAGSTTETLRNVELVKSLGLESQESERLNKVNDQILGLELKKVRLIRVLSFVQGTLVNAMRSLILLLMLWLIFNKIITVGEFFSLFIYSFFIFQPVQEFGTVVSQYQEAKASIEQLETILKVPAEPKPEKPVDIGPLTSIKFEGISFTYSSGSTPSLKDINLTTKGGETVAFVGPSGSGKTTVVKLIVGLYKPTEGKLLLNGIQGKEVDYEKLRKKIGLVSQDTQLFAGTIRENLLFVRPEATDPECIEALRLAAALTIIERGDKGLDTKIGEGGIKISGGERQRLAIARALLRNPELIIFDEATSSLDSITEKAITKTIQDIETSRPNLIRILVAHRLSTVAHATKIYVLEKGSIVEEGNHQTLLETKGLYAALWREQSAQKENDPVKAGS